MMFVREVDDSRVDAGEPRPTITTVGGQILRLVTARVL
jgi:hypothetical protein